MAAAASGARYGTIDNPVVVDPHPSGQPIPAGYVGLYRSADPSKVTYLVHIPTFRKYSKFGGDVILSDDAEPQELGLDSDHATQEGLAFLATWFARRQDHIPSKIRVPTPEHVESELLFRDQWDHEFLNQRVCPAVEPTEKNVLKMPSELTNAKALINLMLLSIYVTADDLTKAVTTWLVFFLRRRVRETGDPEGVVSKWLQRGAFTQQEKDDAKTWWDDATKNVEHPPPPTEEEEMEEFMWAMNEAPKPKKQFSLELEEEGA